MKQLTWLLLALLFLTACSKKKPTFQLDPPVPAKAIIYHLNVRDFTPEGNFKAMHARLSELRDLGVNTLILAPIHPIGVKNRQGKLGSLYASTDFNGIHPDLGTKADFQELLDSCHANGLYVLMEWAANRTAADHPWLSSQPNWYTTDSLFYPLNTKATMAKLNLNDSLLQQELAGQMTYWVDSMGIDGFYASAATAYPTAWWSATIEKLKKIKPLLLLANGSDRTLAEAGFDLLSTEPFPSMLDQMFGKSTDMPIFSAMPIRFHSLTDNSTTDSLNLPILRYGSRKAALIAGLMSVIMPGQPFLFAGEEVGHATPIFAHDKNLILWGSNTDFRSFYSTLLKLRIKEEALNGDFILQDSVSNPKLLLLRRGNGLGTIHCLINPTDSLATLKVPLDLQGKRFMDCFTGKSVLLEQELLMLEYSFYLLKADAAS